MSAPMTGSIRGVLLLAAPADNTVSPGVLGFVVVALLGVATWLLVRSMRRQIKKIDIPDDGTPTRPDDEEDHEHQQRQ
jgi:hypothetical protein